MRTKRILTWIGRILIYCFAVAGLVLIVGFFAVKYHITDELGIVDSHNQDFKELSVNTPKQKVENPIPTATTSSLDDINKSIVALKKIRDEKVSLLCDIQALGLQYPKNANAVMTIYQATHDDVLVQKMIFAATLQMKDNGNPLMANCDKNSITEQSVAQALASPRGDNLYPWINKEEWTTITGAIVKDKDVITKAATVADIDPRLIVSNLAVEQLRLFNTSRELFKKFFQPLTILGNATQTSLGVMGIKEATAKQIEDHLHDTTSPYYLGAAHEHDLDFSTKDVSGERLSRLANEKDHYYSYLYAGLYLQQMITQWERAGFPIQDRPEIVGTLFNVGFSQSKPNADPKVGGSTITITDKKYSFGSLAFEFFYSGELMAEFPLHSL